MTVMILLHATCVSIDGAGVLLRGPSGTGKSDLALRLIDEGAVLVADDYCEATALDGHVWVQAPATISGKMEVRGFGIVDMPTMPRVMVALVIDLMPAVDIPRLPETTTCTIAETSVAWMALDPSAASATARVRLAVRAVKSASTAINKTAMGRA